MVRWSKCKRCYNRKKGRCNMICSKKGNERIIPKKFTMVSIRDALESNIGVSISLANISIYSREIERLLNG